MRARGRYRRYIASRPERHWMWPAARGPGIERRTVGSSNSTLRQRPNQVLANGYLDKSGRPFTQWLNPNAYDLPPLGSYGNLGDARTYRFPCTYNTQPERIHRGTGHGADCESQRARWKSKLGVPSSTRRTSKDCMTSNSRSVPKVCRARRSGLYHRRRAPGHLYSARFRSLG